MQATLRELNNNSSALARAAQAGETIVITDRGTPIVDMVPHVEAVWVARAQVGEALRVLRATLLNPGSSTDVIRQEMDKVVDPFADPAVEHGTAP